MGLEHLEQKVEELEGVMKIIIELLIKQDRMYDIFSEDLVKFTEQIEG
jgi:hypothetical protein